MMARSPRTSMESPLRRERTFLTAVAKDGDGAGIDADDPQGVDHRASAMPTISRRWRSARQDRRHDRRRLRGGGRAPWQGGRRLRRADGGRDLVHARRGDRRWPGRRAARREGPKAKVDWDLSAYEHAPKPKAEDETTETVNIDTAEEAFALRSMMRLRGSEPSSGRSPVKPMNEIEPQRALAIDLLLRPAA
jgi:hypothetical protein